MRKIIFFMLLCCITSITHPLLAQEITETPVADNGAQIEDRPLVEYDVSAVTLTTRYNSQDSLFSVQIPSGWRFADYNTVGADHPEAYGFIFDLPTESLQAVIMAMDVTGELALPDNMNTTAEYMLAARQAHPDFLGPNTLLQHSEFLINGIEAVSMTLSGDSGVTHAISLGLTDSWIASASIQAENADMIALYEAEMVAALRSIEFNLGGSVIRSDVLRVDLPDEWMLVTFEQDNLFFRFIMHPRGDQTGERAADRMVIVIADIAGNPLHDMIQMRGLAAGLIMSVSSDGLRMIGSERTRTVGEYFMVWAEAFSESYQAYYRYSMAMLNDDWVLLLISASPSQETAREIGDTLFGIIEAAEISLP